MDKIESTTNKIKQIQQYLVSLVDRILHIIGDMNLRLTYIMELCLGLSKTPQRKTPQSNKD